MASSVTRPSAPVPPQSRPEPAGSAAPSWTSARASALRQLASSRWSVSAVFAGVAVIVSACSFFAGVQYRHLEVALLDSQLQRMQKDASRANAGTQAGLGATAGPPSAGASANTSNPRVDDSLREHILKLEAQNAQYQTLLDRHDAEHSAGRSLLAVLAVAHSNLIPMKPATPGAPPIVAYLLTAPGGRFVFIASSLPPVTPGHQYQLWFFRNDAPSALRGPVFDLKQPMSIDLNQILPAGISSLELTEEPAGGSEAPSTPPLAACSIGH